ncbi:alpha-galactosidase [Arcticibacterium luteifluviistationis]|uniref:Alpha-galactosidase n=1 Tax=Arcticibacterium luteifluviistationis TaxID=1784714 RepID=A0A2Z4GFS0_9BACT|nr:alpha-galactosidase [Arcticibacterium luteifluviistationis]AWW00157.1 alpha-galactosidase [Arcticibacterium luteifluviistationis]
MKEKLLLICLFISTITIAQDEGLIGALNSEKDSIESCYSILQNDTLTIGNSFIERRFRWNGGHVISIDIANKKSGKTINIKNGNTPDFGIKGLPVNSKKNNYSSTAVNASPIIPSHLMIQVLLEYEGLEVKQIFKVFPSSMGISSEYSLKKINSSLQFNAEDISIEQLNIENIHWAMEAIEFIDNTDRNNTFVKKENLLPYKSNEYVGNILYMSSLTENKGLYFLKEAPCSTIQLNYPGYDFSSYLKPNSTIVKSAGLGIKPEDLIINEWVKTFGYVIGVHDNQDITKKIALRSYQTNLRISRPDRDEMMMVNTWGDRNKDTKLREQFILDELKEAHKFGFTHYQIDDGWQQGLSKNSGVAGERLWDQWSFEDWLPNKQRFPNGFNSILALADSLNIKIGLWFHPSNENEYANWSQDADIVINLYRTFGITNIKVDGIKLPTKKADINLERFFNKILAETNYEMVFNVDATADNRYGYHYNNHLGNIFLENRYTDFKNYYPYQTLRNLWMLSAYMPSQRLQIEFLNKWRRAEVYGDEPFAPGNYSFDYVFAITMPSQPLGFFETTGLPDEADKSIELFKQYKAIHTELHNAQIFPIGNEPNGKSFTGFQFLTSDTEGYVLVFRELNDSEQFNLPTLFAPDKKVKFKKVYGDGFDFKAKTDYEGKVIFNIDKPNSFCLYKYTL